MEVKAVLKNANIGALKLFPLANFIRGRSVNHIIRVLALQKTKPSQILYKLIQSAAASAEHKQTIDVNNLYIKSIQVDRGPARQSFMPRARGRASAILKRTSHINLVLSERIKKRDQKKDKQIEKTQKKQTAKKADQKGD